MAFEDLRLEFVVDKPGFDPGTFDVVDFSGEERISQPFRFDVNLVSHEPQLVLADVANEPATIEVHRGDDMLIFHGQVIHFEQGVHVGDHYAYRAVFGPLLWYLSLTFQSRIFQQMTIQEIVEKVLKDAGLAASQYRFDLQDAYPKREYCVQYNETDLNFINRWLEHDGIRYFFDENVVVFTDKPAGSAPPIPGNVPLVFNPGGGLEAAAEAVREFICQERLVTGKVLLKDYNYRTPETVLESESQINQDMKGVHYEYGQHFPDVGEGNRLARVRNQEIECQRRVMHGESGYVGLRAGHIFEMKEHFRSDFNGKYLLTSLRHAGQQAGAVAGVGREASGQTSAYACRFACIPTDVMFRPPRLTPVPKIPGIMSGRIEKPGGDYAHMDEEGRYRARMYFDLGEAAKAEATHPIRMKQAYSGPGYGIHFPNHADTEMVWACVDGNPDRPMALGTSPNPTQKAPSTSENKTQNVIKTFSGNQMVMDDMKDEEQILISTPAVNSLLFDDKDDRIFLTTTEKHQALFDDKNKNITVQTTDGHFLLMDDKNEKITLQSKKGHYITVNDKDDIITIADKDKKHTFTIDIANQVVVVKTDTGNIEIHAPKGLIDVKAKELKVETTGDMTFKAGGNITMDAKGNVKIKAGMNVDSEAGVNHTSKGLNTTSEASLQHQTKGTMTKVDGAALVQVQGALVKIN